MIKVTEASEKGLRPYQEDRYVISKIPHEGYLLATFDGHGGSECADYCAENLVSLFHSAAAEDDILENVIRNVFKLLNLGTEYMGSGCAASIAFIPENGSEVIVGVLGDAPVLVKKKDGELWLAPEHNVRTNEAEASAAKDRGGFIQGGYLFGSRFGSGGLQMSRALGDCNIDVLNREPEIFRLPIDLGSFVLVGTDGLFDPSHATSPVEFIAAAIESGSNARDLVQRALAIPTGDNVTAILAVFGS